MTEDKVYTPQVIADQPFPVQDEAIGHDTSTSSTKEVFQVESLPTQSFPTKKIAVELIGSMLNTKSRTILGEFKLAESGGFQIGKYQNGVTGDLRITPAGITARDKAGITTFALDATTGDAVFKGSIQAGSLITGAVVVGDNRVIIDGENSRIIVYDDDGIPRILIGYQKDGF